jgi:CRP-like cAMP-binding protein
MPLTASTRSSKGRKSRTAIQTTRVARVSSGQDIYVAPKPAEAVAPNRQDGAVEIDRLRRQSVFREGMASGTIYEIIEGSVIIFKTLADGRRQIFDILGPGSLIGNAAGQTYNYSAECLTKCRLLKYSPNEVAVSATLQQRLSQQLLRMIEALQEHALLLGRRTAMERIASFLLALPQLSIRLGRQPGEGLLQTALKQRDIGDYLGLKVETVSRNLAILKRRTIIATGKRGQFRLLDMAALQRMANP